ncbi:MAG: hypothetical protein CR965_00470 [Paludibacter sp.]|nr:MAG: hypothetical protein CR965_00470 [Paludibacter sp.]
MFKKILTTIVFFYITLISFAQMSPVVPNSIAVSNTSTAVLDEWNAFQNVTALAHVNKLEVATQYENKFMIPELGTGSVQAGFNAKYINVGFSYSYQGYSLYNEMIAGVGLARNFGDKFSMGLQFNYYTAYFSAKEESRYRGTVVGQLGVVAHITPKLIVGFHSFNPFQTNIKTEYSEKVVPSIYSFGSNYAFNKNFRWLMQVDKEVSTDFRFASSFEYTMIDALTFRLGASSSEYLIPTFGFGVHLGRFHINLNGELHPILGFNSMANLKYKF